MSTRRGLAAVTLSLALAATATACGTATAPGTGTSAAATSTAPSGPKAGESVDFAALMKRSNAAMKKAGTARGTMTMDGTQVAATFDFGVDPEAFDMTIDDAGESGKVRSVGGVLYMSGDGLEEMSGGKPWVKIDPEGDDMMSQMMAPMLKSMGSSLYPARVFEAMKGITAVVRSVEGDVTTYAVELTPEALQKMAAQMLEGLGEDVPSAIPTPQATGTVTMTMSFGPGDLPVAYELTGMEGTDGLSGMKGTYTDWGKAPKITAPPASEVGTFEMPDLG